MYKQRLGDGVQPACGRSRLVYDPAGQTDYGGLPVMSPASAWHASCALFALKTQHSWCMEGCDVKKAYLNGKLPEGQGYWARLPKGYEEGNEGKLLYFSSGIYGAGPSGRTWYETNNKTLLDFGCRCLKCEPTVWVRRDARGLLICAFNTDDGIILASNQKLADDFKAYYNGEFNVRWGKITRFGGVNVLSLIHI